MSDAREVVITVNELNTAPVLAPIGAKSVNAGTPLAFPATAADRDLPANVLSFSLDPAAAALGMSIDAATGVFNWTPSLAQGGKAHSVAVTVSDSGTPPFSDAETLQVTVNSAGPVGLVAAYNFNAGSGTSLSTTQARRTPAQSPAPPGPRRESTAARCHSTAPAAG